MHLCKDCIFMEIDKNKECYWCILKEIELTNHSNIEVCDDRIVEFKELYYEKEYTVRNNRPAEDTRRWVRRNNLRKMWRQCYRFSKSNSRRHRDVQRVLSGWSRYNFGCYN